MKALLIILFLGVVPALTLAYAADPGAVSALTRVLLYVQFDRTAPQPVFDSMRKEVDVIMAPAGFHIEWRSLPSTGDGETASELAVITVKGSCDVNRPAPHNMNVGALGWTHLSDGVILPFTDLDCSGLNSFIGAQLAGMRPAERANVFGRALGRVLAHELYHIFANTRHHAHDGVGKSSYSVEDLLSDSFRFGEREAAALRAPTL